MNVSFRPYTTKIVVNSDLRIPETQLKSNIFTSGM